MMRNERLKLIIPAIVILLTVVMIFSASLQTADASRAQSGFVKGKLDLICSVLFDADYDDIFPEVRKVAHFAEFALLGAECAVFCALNKMKTVRSAFIGITVAVCDEALQLTSDGRAGSIKDVLLDLSGFATGVLFVMLCTLLIGLYKNYRREKNGE